MKNFINKYIPNIILLLLSILLFIYFEPKYLIGTIPLILSYLYQKNSINNKQYIYATLYKIFFNLILYLLVIISFIYCFNTNGWNALGYAAISFFLNLLIALDCIINFLIRLFFRIKYKQYYSYKEHIILNTIQIIITFISIIGPFIFFFIMDMA